MQFILVHLFLIILSFLFCADRKIHYTTWYAMVSHIYCKHTLESTKSVSKQIKIHKCNKYLLYKIQHSKQTLHHKTRHINFNNASLEGEIYILQKAGCIRSINKYIVLYSKYKQEIFNINIYPVINRINIREYRKLKISIKFLKRLFINQLGLPKNYLLIDSIIHRIYNWYISHGYYWSRVNINRQPYTHKVSIKIDEGKIYRIQIKCKTKNIKKNMKFINCTILS
uniref:POTRA domain-containing protein n=1 Tax=Gracilaria vermiculophylla TaxID=2608709 RepID=A0A345U8X5_9FLOR|nr:hypothetical protein [Gracilaria vermiculophylla]AXI96911.1 hypothetical protein [Gracilaria vermiculophylla]